MRTNEILKQINKLPISKRKYVIEKTIQSITSLEVEKTMKEAAEILYDDYNTDRQLTVFTNIDFDNFYEAK